MKTAAALAPAPDFAADEIDRALALFCAGHDTGFIAQMFGRSEAEIYNALPKWRAMRRAAA